jgi:hypothetical protein
MVSKCLAFLVKEKNKYKVSACSFKTTANRRIFQKATSNFCFGFPLLSLVDFLYIQDRLLEQFQNHRRLSKQLLKSQAAVEKPEKVS